MAFPYLTNLNYNYNLTNLSIVDETNQASFKTHSSVHGSVYVSIAKYTHRLTFRTSDGQSIPEYDRFYSAVKISGNNLSMSYSVRFPQNMGVVTLTHEIYALHYGYTVGEKQSSGTVIDSYEFTQEFRPTVRTYTFDTGGPKPPPPPPPPPSGFEIDFALNATTGKPGDTFTASPTLTGTTTDKIAFLRWSSSELSPTPSTGSPVSFSPKQLSFASAGQKSITLEMRDVNGISRTKTKSVEISTKKYITTQMRIVVKYTAAQSQFVNLPSLDDYNNNLFDALSAAKSDGQVLYFAPRYWPEAGKVVDFFKDTYEGQPAVSIIVERRIGDSKSGMESFEYDDLPIISTEQYEDEKVGTEYSPRPRGCVFTTVNNEAVDSFMLSSPNSISVRDAISLTHMQKDGVDEHPVVVFSQSKSEKYNALGEFDESTNYSWTYGPFIPFLSILRKDHYSTSTKPLYASVFDKYSVSSSTPYINTHNMRTSPFDDEYLKTRSSQHRETSSLLAENPDVYDTDAATSPWGRADAPELGKTLVSYEYTGADDNGPDVVGADVTWESAGVLFRPATTGGESTVSWIKSTAPYWSGSATAAEEKRMIHDFESYDGIYMSTGTVDSGDGVFTDQKKIVSMSLWGAPLYYSIAIKNFLSYYPSIIDNLDELRILAVPPDKRYLIFANGNRFYIYDTMALELLNPSGTTYTNTDITQSIKNMQKMGELALPWKSNGMTQDSQNLGKFNKIPLNPDFFSGSTVLFNFERDNYSISFGSLSSDGSVSTGWSSAVNTAISTRLTLMDGYVYYGTTRGFGIFSYAKDTSYYYYVDEETGDIKEEFNSGKVTSVFRQEIDNSTGSVSIKLLPSNTEQSVYIGGKINDIPFGSSARVRLCETVIPLFDNSKTGKVFKSELPETGLYQFHVLGMGNLSPESCILCPIAMLTSEGYSSYFAASFNELSGQSLMRATSQKLSAISSYSGNYQMTLGITQNGSSNWTQNTVSEMAAKFSRDVVIVNDEDITTTVINSVSRNGKNYVNGNEIKIGLSIKAIATFVVSESDSIIYDAASDSTSISFEESWFPATIAELETAFPGHNPLNRMKNCFVVCPDYKFKVSAVGNNSITLAGNAQALSGETLAVVPFAPKTAMIYESISSSKKPVEITVKQVVTADNTVICNDITIPVSVDDSNGVTLALIEDKTTYLRAMDVTFQQIASGKSQFVDITYHGSFDATNNVFYNTYGYGTGTRSALNQLFGAGVSTFYVKISSVTPFDLSKEIKLEFVDSSGVAVLGSPYILTGDNVLDEENRVLKLEVSVESAVKAKANMEMTVKLTATSINGQKIIL